MERRGFIKGLLVSASAVAGTALVKLAEPGEAQALVAQRNLILSQPEEPNIEDAMAAVNSGFEIYARLSGRGFVPIGYLTSIQVDTPVDALYSYSGEIHGTNPEYIAGLKKITMSFRGPRL